MKDLCHIYLVLVSHQGKNKTSINLPVFESVAVGCYVKKKEKKLKLHQRIIEYNKQTVVKREKESYYKLKKRLFAQKETDRERIFNKSQ